MILLGYIVAFLAGMFFAVLLIGLMSANDE